MKNILIFRTDRIGDFLVISPIFSSLKRNFKNCKIDIICSKMNYRFVRSFQTFNNVYLYPDTFIKKFFFFINLKKYDCIIVTDEKKRSIYISFFKLCKYKYLFTPSINIKKLFKYFFNKVFIINYNIPKIKFIENFLSEINCDLKNEDINFILNYENSTSINNNFLKEKYIIFNFDEKWIYNNYIKSYEVIEPSKLQFLEFISELSVNQKVIIVNGYKNNPILDEINFNNFSNIILKKNVDIFELQTLIKYSKCLITCHGAPSHIASNYNVKIIDIVDSSEIKFFESYNHHFKNKIQLMRTDFDSLSKKILSNINN